MKSILIGVLVILIALATFSYLVYRQPEVSAQGLKRFNSYEELKNFVKTGEELYLPYDTFGASASTFTTGEVAPKTMNQNAPATSGAEVPGAATEYSGTNMQVTGVDEADIVKNDGKYIYVGSGNNLTILDAYPAENANVKSKIELDGSISGIFVNKDRLVVFGSKSYYPYPSPLGGGVAIPEIYPGPYYYPQAFVYVYDISDRSNPVITRNISLNGTYFDSRMIGDYVYVIVNEPLEYSGDEIMLPAINEGGVVKSVSAPQIYYSGAFDYSYTFTSILAINTQNDNQDLNSKTILTGWTQNIYVSLGDIYIVYPKTYSITDYYDRIVDEAVMPLVPSDVQQKINDARALNISDYDKMSKIGTVMKNYIDSLNPEQAATFMQDFQNSMDTVMKEIAKELEKTVIHKISIDNGNIEYKTTGEVPGRILNQYSMDEQNNYFRIATTSGQFWRSSPFNNVYVLDDSLKIVGKIEEISPGETIFAARFLGDKVYLVTYKRTDPLFVIDLSDPTNPKVLGELKIPGHSDYLHPYDENHLIGVGKDSDENGRDLGVKISLFDITDFSNPKEISNYTIGTRGSYTPVSNDPKAFLFSKSNGLMVVPISVSNQDYQQDWQGAYAFNVDLTSGITLKGKITHLENQTQRWYDYGYDVDRSLYMDNVLYTISNRMIKMNDLTTMSEINKIGIN